MCYKDDMTQNRSAKWIFSHSLSSYYINTVGKSIYSLWKLKTQIIIPLTIFHLYKEICRETKTDHWNII